MKIEKVQISGSHADLILEAQERSVSDLPLSYFYTAIPTAEKITGLKFSNVKNIKKIIRYINLSINYN